MGKKIFSGFIPIRVRTFRDFMQKSSSTIIKKINVKNKSICKRFNEQKGNYLATDGKIIMKKRSFVSDLLHKQTTWTLKYKMVNHLF